MASQAIFREQAIDAAIKSSGTSIQEIRRRRNTLAPISALPIEIITAIFFLLRTIPPSSPYFISQTIDRLEWLRVAHVCHQWREIALNQPLLWSHVNFTSFSSAGATEVLNRAKTAPLHLEARFSFAAYDARIITFNKELRTRISHVFYLGITAQYLYLRQTLEELVSPAPILEYLSLHGGGAQEGRVFVSDTLFDGITPRLLCLELFYCDVSWKSPLFKGLKYLEIRELTPNARPSLSIWLDALDKMPQLKMLALYWASPIAPTGVRFLSCVERTITLPSLATLDISASARDCGLALAHLVLPALNHLGIAAQTSYLESQSASDMQEIILHLPRLTHGLQDTQPIRSVFVYCSKMGVNIVAWTLPDVNFKLPSQILSSDPTPSALVAFSVSNMDQSPETYSRAFNAAMAALPLYNIVTLTTDKFSVFDEQFWLRYAPGWPLLRNVHLGPPAVLGFMSMLLAENGEHKCPLLPSLKKLKLVNIRLSASRTLFLCDALMKRVEQGVLLETLDLRTCLATNCAVKLLGKVVVEVLAPEETLTKTAQNVSRWESVPGGHFVPDPSNKDEPWDHWEVDITRYENEDHWPHWQ